MKLRRRRRRKWKRYGNKVHNRARRRALGTVPCARRAPVIFLDELTPAESISGRWDWCPRYFAAKFLKNENGGADR